MHYIRPFLIIELKSPSGETKVDIFKHAILRDDNGTIYLLRFRSQVIFCPFCSTVLQYTRDAQTFLSSAIYRVDIKSSKWSLTTCESQPNQTTSEKLFSLPFPRTRELFALSSFRISNLLWDPNSPNERPVCTSNSGSRDRAPNAFNLFDIALFIYTQTRFHFSSK